MLKQGREVKTQISDLFRTSYGTVDVTSLKSLFINLSTWAEPLEEHENWSGKVKKFKNKIKTNIHNNIENPLFKQISIVDLDLRGNCIKIGKRSFIRCEITLFLKPKQKIDMKSKTVSGQIQEITTKVIEDSFLTSRTFKFYSTKK